MLGNGTPKQPVKHWNGRVEIGPCLLTRRDRRSGQRTFDVSAGLHAGGRAVAQIAGPEHSQPQQRRAFGRTCEDVVLGLEVGVVL